MSTASAHCWCAFPSDRGELSGLRDMAHSRTSRKGAARAGAARYAPCASGLQYAELIPAAGGFQPLERPQGLGEIDRLPGEVLRAVLRRRRPGNEKPLREIGRASCRERV